MQRKHGRGVAFQKWFESSRIMETNDAVRSLGALAQETRLSVFRLLMQAGAAGLAAGALAERLGVANATLSFHMTPPATSALLAVGGGFLLP
jgi:predicted transcriptional regulator